MPKPNVWAVLAEQGTKIDFILDRVKAIEKNTETLMSFRMKIIGAVSVVSALISIGISVVLHFI